MNLILPILGFGRAGPVKGEYLQFRVFITFLVTASPLINWIHSLTTNLGGFAALAQRVFFGSLVPKGSLFAVLQKTAMKGMKG
jgi:hypothetical protein